MRSGVISRIEARFAAYADIAAAVDSEQIHDRLDIPRHRTVAEHLWCVISSRLTYARSIEASATEEWRGAEFSREVEGFRAQLASSAASAKAAIAGVEAWTPERDELLLDLAEHEAMHEAQIIRHFFAAALPMPPSLRWAACD